MSERKSVAENTALNLANRPPKGAIDPRIGGTRIALCALGGLTVLGTFGIAQSQEQASQTGFVSEDYEVSSTDENGVDMISGSVRLEQNLLSIGPEGSALSYSVTTPSLAQTGSADDSQLQAVGLPINTFRGSPFKFDSFSGGVQLSGIDDCNNWFQYGGSRADFCGSIANGLTAKDGSNASLVQVGSDYLFTTTDGTEYLSTSGVAQRTTEQSVGLKKITSPTGYTIDIVRNTGVITVTDNRGLAIRATTSDNWTNTAITGYNTTIDTCNPTSTSCSFTETWPSGSVYIGNSTNAATATNMHGQTTKLFPKARSNTFTGYFYHKVKPAGVAETATIEYTYCAPWDDNGCGNAPISCGPGTSHPPAVCREFSMVAGKVRTATKNGKTWEYNFWYAEE